MNDKHCPSCGYTEEDAKFHMDHNLCKNAGNAPWEKKSDRASKPAAPPVEEGEVARHDEWYKANYARLTTEYAVQTHDFKKEYIFSQGAWNAAKASSPVVAGGESREGKYMNEWANFQLAERIAADLFTNGNQQEAQRLVLELPSGGNGGGWCRRAVIDVIARHLNTKVAGGDNETNTPCKRSKPGLNKVTDVRNDLVAMEIPDPACSDMRNRIVMVFDILTQVLLEHFPLIAESSEPLIKDVRGKE